jgi:hypothetical protein
MPVYCSGLCVTGRKCPLRSRTELEYTQGVKRGGISSLGCRFENKDI